MVDFKVKSSDGGVVFTVKVIPSASRTVIAELLDGMLKVKVSSPPEHGKANRSLIEFIAKKLGVKKKDISIVSGLTSPVKRLSVSNISRQRLLEKLNLNR